MGMDSHDDASADKACEGAADAKKKKRRSKKKKTDAAGDAIEAADGSPPIDSAPSGEPCAAFEAPPWPGQPEPTGCVEEEWVDISAQCDLAIAGMAAGEMLESPSFRLQDAMSAIEIMDPKMDSGFKNSEDMTLDRAFELGIITPELSLEKLVAIWDQLLMYYLVWLEGETIVQTFFCCLYLHDLERCVKPMPAFAAFVEGFFAACRHARNTILRAGVYDEEDFNPNLYGVDLDLSDFSSCASEAQKRIDTETKVLVKNPSLHAKAACLRLEFVGQYVMALAELNPPRDGKRNVPSAVQRLTKCLELLEKMAANAKKPSPELLQSFDASVNRKLLVPGPPRTVKPIEDPSVVLETWSSHIQELLLCGSIVQKPLSSMLMGAITFKGEPNILPRSVAQLAISDRTLVQKLVMESLQHYLFPADAPQHCRKSTESFMEGAQCLLAHLLKLAHANLARKFRRLAHVFPELNHLQHQAWSLDEELKKVYGANLRYARPCWVWVMEHTLQMMIAKLFLGLELDLYEDAELHMIYWYADYLYGLRIYNMNEVYHHKEQPAGGDKRSSGRSAAEARRKQQQARSGAKPKVPPAELLMLEATQSVVRGLFRLLAYCLREGLIKTPKLVSEGMDQRFVLRFRSLEHFRLPHLPSYRDFQQSSASAQAPVESNVVLDAAQSSFQDAASTLERLEKSKDGSGRDVAVSPSKMLMRVVVANKLAIMQMSKALQAGTQCKITVGPSHHPHLVSVTVLPS